MQMAKNRKIMLLIYFYTAIFDGSVARLLYLIKFGIVIFVQLNAPDLV